MFPSYMASAGQRLISCILVVSLVLGPSTGYAQSALSVLPQPGQMIGTTPAFTPPILKGMVIHPEDPLKFDFLMDTGTARVAGEDLRVEADKSIKYFLSALTVPEENMWVNLSPVEKDRIIPDEFGKTVMGRDLLGQDYILKGLASSLLYPESDLGKEFWARIYEAASKELGTTDIDMSQFNRVWIEPDAAQVWENDGKAVILKSHLKVMLETDYQAQGTRHKAHNEAGASDPSELTKQFFRSVILPVIEKEVNEGAHFAPLRQIYSAMILSAWYKIRLKESLLARAYADKSKVFGIEFQDGLNKDAIYARYLETVRKGVFNYIKEEPVTSDVRRLTSDELVPRRYFSGGFSSAMMSQVVSAGLMIAALSGLSPEARAQADAAARPQGEMVRVSAGVQDVGPNADREHLAQASNQKAGNSAVVQENKDESLALRLIGMFVTMFLLKKAFNYFDRPKVNRTFSPSIDEERHGPYADKDGNNYYWDKTRGEYVVEWEYNSESAKTKDSANDAEAAMGLQETSLALMANVPDPAMVSAVVEWVGNHPVLAVTGILISAMVARAKINKWMRKNYAPWVAAEALIKQGVSVAYWDFISTEHVRKAARLIAQNRSFQVVGLDKHIPEEVIREGYMGDNGSVDGAYNNFENIYTREAHDVPDGIEITESAMSEEESARQAERAMGLGKLVSGLIAAGIGYTLLSITVAITPPGKTQQEASAEFLQQGMRNVLVLRPGVTEEGREKVKGLMQFSGIIWIAVGATLFLYGIVPDHESAMIKEDSQAPAESAMMARLHWIMFRYKGDELRSKLREYLDTLPTEKLKKVFLNRSSRGDSPWNMVIDERAHLVMERQLAAASLEEVSRMLGVNQPHGVVRAIVFLKDQRTVPLLLEKMADAEARRDYERYNLFSDALYKLTGHEGMFQYERDYGDWVETKPAEDITYNGGGGYLIPAEGYYSRNPGWNKINRHTREVVKRFESAMGKEAVEETFESAMLGLSWILFRYNGADLEFILENYLRRQGIEVLARLAGHKRVLVRVKAAFLVAERMEMLEKEGKFSHYNKYSSVLRRFGDPRGRFEYVEETRTVVDYQEENYGGTGTEFASIKVPVEVQVGTGIWNKIDRNTREVVKRVESAMEREVEKTVAIPEEGRQAAESLIKQRIDSLYWNIITEDNIRRVMELIAQGKDFSVIAQTRKSTVPWNDNGNQLTEYLEVEEPYGISIVESSMVKEADRISVASATKDLGGIDLDARKLDLQIKRDENGVALPVSDQPWETINIQGFIPVIYRIEPVNMPLLLGLNSVDVKGAPVSAELQKEFSVAREPEPLEV